MWYPQLLKGAGEHWLNLLNRKCCRKAYMFSHNIFTRGSQFFFEKWLFWSTCVVLLCLSVVLLPCFSQHLNCSYTCTLHIYMYISTHTHTHTHTSYDSARSRVDTILGQKFHPLFPRQRRSCDHERGCGSFPTTSNLGYGEGVALAMTDSQQVVSGHYLCGGTPLIRTPWNEDTSINRTAGTPLIRTPWNEDTSINRTAGTPLIRHPEMRTPQFEDTSINRTPSN